MTQQLVQPYMSPQMQIAALNHDNAKVVGQMPTENLY